MQTFLPYESFHESARCLDRLRLGKQRIEAYQVLISLSDPGYGWQNHPAVRMWRGHEVWCAGYAQVICDEWVRRGYRDTVRQKVLSLVERAGWDIVPPPPWLGLDSFHLSHRSNLVRKDPSRYGIMWPEVRPDLPYFWPR